MRGICLHPKKAYSGAPYIRYILKKNEAVIPGITALLYLRTKRHLVPQLNLEFYDRNPKGVLFSAVLTVAYVHGTTFRQELPQSAG